MHQHNKGTLSEISEIIFVQMLILDFRLKNKTLHSSMYEMGLVPTFLQIFLFPSVNNNHDEHNMVIQPHERRV